MNKPDFAPEAELVHIANKTLGLSELAPFDAQKKSWSTRCRRRDRWRR